MHPKTLTTDPIAKRGLICADPGCANVVGLCADGSGVRFAFCDQCDAGLPDDLRFKLTDLQSQLSPRDTFQGVAGGQGRTARGLADAVIVFGIDHE